MVNDEWLTWNQYHETVAAAMGAPKPELIHIPTDLLVKATPEHAFLARDNFQFNNIFDTSAARNDLGFRQTVSFEDGMRDTIRWVEAAYGFDSSDSFPLYDKLIHGWQRLGGALAAELAN